ncbi:hypothetical protein [Stratiformator vulcanicus]|uniref:EF-hand domain-containing protein n=1 Tax=Stratiformator vulcanicus TaxID=2527980 RepID=A0A517QX67_9PLAN|nr:hypothetical protein [Stratiformator vulcanicus]QDT36231.1 hypothetical protein Pan189_05860 [Stratiformator vulcanicus]
MNRFSILFCFVITVALNGSLWAEPSQRQLDAWLKRFPEADTNGDGRLTAEEAATYRQKVTKGRPEAGGAPRTFSVDAGWDADRFPDDAVCYLQPEEIAKLYRRVTRPETPKDGSLRIVATGHSFMAPGFRTLPAIAKAGGFEQQTLLTHVGGGITGSARFKWEQENGIFQFKGRPTPKLLASISNAKWDTMLWGPYFNDRPEYYRCWIDFCLKYNPEMKFYLSDAWPQLYQLKSVPSSEEELSAEVIARMGTEKHAIYAKIIGTLNREYPGKVFVLPTSDAMVIAAEYYHRGELPGVEGLHTSVGGQERSLWRDRLGHLGPGFGRLEGYVFYATLYGRSPELIEGSVAFKDRSEYPSDELDRAFRKIAWQAVINNPLTGVTDRDSDGVDDNREEP